MPNMPHRHKYPPLTVMDLSKNDLTLLIEILKIPNPRECQKISYHGGKRIEWPNEFIQSACKRLPSTLHSRLAYQLVPNSIIRAANLCASHKGLNPYVINHIFELVKREVTVYLDIFDRNPENLRPNVKDLLHALRSIQGMWWGPSANDSLPPRAGATPQENKCEACMLARVVNEPLHLLNLRATLLSRTRTKMNRRVPKLLGFIDSALRECQTGEELTLSSIVASNDLKEARKDAVRKRRAKARESQIHQQGPSDDDVKSQSVFIYFDPTAVDVAVPTSQALSSDNSRLNTLYDEMITTYKDLNTHAEEEKEGERELEDVPLKYDPKRNGLVRQPGPFDDLIREIDDCIRQNPHSKICSQTNDCNADFVTCHDNLLHRQIEYFSDSEDDAVED